MTIKNNNPGNLRYNYRIQWMGLSKPPEDEHGFCIFTEPLYGIRALARDLHTAWDLDNLKTIEQIVLHYAPPSENNTEAYIADVSQQLGIARDRPVDLKQEGNLVAFVRAIIRHECGQIPYDADLIVKSVRMALR